MLQKLQDFIPFAVERVDFKNIIFDLGGVIVNIAPQRSLRAFSMLSGFTEEELYNSVTSSEIVKHFEKGWLHVDAFRNSLRQIFQQNIPNKKLDAAWNQVIGDIPPARLTLLKNLCKQYKLFLLSNTNPIHLRKIQEVLYTTAGIKALQHFFTKTYYSFQTGYVKPEIDAFKSILHENHLLPEETLFVDDTIENIEAASSLKMNVLHVRTDTTLLEYFTHAI
ncbi:MAG: HAD family phosphatase [Cytophagales bacterium]|nr:HAD family phosphatase [Cytophagales bacterium]